MFNKEYVLGILYRCVCLKIHNREKWIEFGKWYYSDDIFDSLDSIIDLTRELERESEKDWILIQYKKWLNDNQ